MRGTISVLPICTGMVWTRINLEVVIIVVIVVVFFLFMFHSCIEKDCTGKPQLVALITDSSHFTQFLLRCSVST